MGGPIPEQRTLDTIEQLLLESTEFQANNIDQIELVKKIILHPGKQIRGDKKVNAIHVIVPEEKKGLSKKSIEDNIPQFTTNPLSGGYSMESYRKYC